MATDIIINHFKENACKHALTQLRSKVRAAPNSGSCSSKGGHSAQPLQKLKSELLEQKHDFI